MNLTEITILGYREKSKITDFDENTGKVLGSHIEESSGSIKYNMGTGTLSIENEDGTGFNLIVSPVIINAISGWIRSNIKKAEEQDKIACQQRDQEHQERMKHLEAQTAEAQLRLEEAKLRHEIKMVELQIELVEKQKELREAKAEAEKANEENEPA